MIENNTYNTSDTAPEILPVTAVAGDFSWLNNQELLDIDETDDSVNEIEYIGFQIADLHLICSFDSISEISNIPDIYRVPHLPPWVRGATSLRGEVAPIIDLALYLNISQRTEASTLVVIGHDNERAGLLVDGRPDIYYFSDQHQLKTDPPVPQELLPHLKTAYQRDGVIWLELEMNTLIDKMIE